MTRMGTRLGWMLLLVTFLASDGCSDITKDSSGSFRGIYFGRAPRKLRDGQGYFEVWLGFPKSGGGKDWVSILKFDRVEGSNHPFLNDVPSVLTKPSRDLDSAVAAAISIELENDPDPAHPNRIFMSGSLSNGVGSMELNGEDAFNMNLKDPEVISGEFVLATPSDSIAGNDASGVWFVDAPFGQAQNPGLHLPTLPSGFKFEAWVATQSETVCISTGQFRRADQADTNGSGTNGGHAPYPNVPGDDLVFDRYNVDVQGRSVPSGLLQAYLDTFKFPIVITRAIQSNPLKDSDPQIGKKDYWDVVVSIEPDPDNDPEEPFAIFPLVKFGPILESTNTVIPMTNFGAGLAQFVTIDVTKM